MNRVPLWRARTDALTHLRSKRPEQLTTLENLFLLTDSCIDAFERPAIAGDRYAEVCGLTLLKAKNLALAAYSLLLDGLGQEAGAVLRPFIEYTELLTYLRKFPHKAEDALTGNLPRAGKRAKAIEGAFQEFREHLNEHASHSSYSRYSLSHLIETAPGGRGFRKLQRMVPEVLERNVGDLAVQIWLMVGEAISALSPIYATTDPKQVENLARRADALKSELWNGFQLEKRREAARLPPVR
jgi:hypothetical protein